MTGSRADGALSVARADGIVTVTLNRPDKANAITMAMLRELTALAGEVAQDAGVKTLVLTGSGGRIFSAGADLTEIRAQVADPDTALAYDALWRETTGSLARLPTPTIALLNGSCIGGGLALVLACDIRLMVDGGQIFYPTLKNGFLPERHDAGRLIGLIGKARTKTLLLGGLRLSAREAHDWGLVDRVFDPVTATEETAAFLAPIVAAETDHLVATKRIIDFVDDDMVTADCHAAVYQKNAAAIQRLRKL
ncbi:MAG: enoyl-CoA hydratase/isomerase family protein [Alphaproteobacteria bacterium]